MKARRTIALVDDHELVARGLATLLEPFYDVAIVAHSGRELLARLHGTHVDCVLLDLSMPDQSGLEVLPTLKRDHSGIRVIMVTMHADRSLVQATMGMGADGYVPKDAGLGELREAIETVLEGRLFVSTRIPRHTEQSGPGAAHPSLASLSPQQERIFLLIGDGLSSAAIGKAMGVTERTVAFHRANIRKKLGIDTELGLHRLAVLIRNSGSETGGSR